MSPVKQLNAGFTPAMASTKATRTSGFAASVSFGSWKRVSPYATKRNGTLVLSCRSTGVCAVDFLVQAANPSSAAVSESNNNFLANDRLSENIGKFVYQIDSNIHFHNWLFDAARGCKCSCG